MDANTAKLVISGLGAAVALAGVLAASGLIPRLLSFWKGGDPNSGKVQPSGSDACATKCTTDYLAGLRAVLSEDCPAEFVLELACQGVSYAEAQAAEIKRLRALLPPLAKGEAK